jgi:predicted double-glycine peptidase
MGHKRLRHNLVLSFFAIFICLPVSHLHASQVDIHFGNMRFNANVKSLHELRWNKLTRQGWDMSCGAAALSTMLTYHNGRPFSEMAITLSILKNSDPALVRKRGGFSLLDLKRFVSAVGLEGLGYGDMTLEDLQTFSTPAILPIRIKDFDHFVVFRKRLGNKIFVGDPAFGNISFPDHVFLKMWKSRIAFYVVTTKEKQQLAKKEIIKALSYLSPQAMEVAIPDPSYISRILGRIPAVPLTRRMVVHSP